MGAFFFLIISCLSSEERNSIQFRLKSAIRTKERVCIYLLYVGLVDMIRSDQISDPCLCLLTVMQR